MEGMWTKGSWSRNVSISLLSRSWHWRGVFSDEWPNAILPIGLRPWGIVYIGIFWSFSMLSARVPGALPTVPVLVLQTNMEKPHLIIWPQRYKHDGKKTQVGENRGFRFPPSEIDNEFHFSSSQSTCPKFTFSSCLLSLQTKMYQWWPIRLHLENGFHCFKKASGRSWGNGCYLTKL